MASIKFPTFPNIDLSALDLSKIDFPKIDFSKLPKPNLPGVDGGAVLAAAKDAGYVTVGLGVLAVQKVQQARRDITKQVRNLVPATSN